MTPSAKPQPVLSDAEWQIVIELLERELAELPSEIHHTHRRVVREELRRREQVVEQLIQRLKS